jgi:hypothetical protein
MRALLLLVLVACGESQKPLLANAPHPDNAAVAGGAAAAAAAMTLADPDAATRGKPEKAKQDDKAPIEVKEHVTPDVLDRLDQSKKQNGQDAPAATPTSAPKKTGKPLPKLPSPKEAAEKEENGQH